MRVLIDGHNVIGALRLKARSHEEVRENLLRRVRSVAPDAKVYFDARDAPPGLASPASEFGVRVQYCRRREADAAILEEVRDADDAREIVVVTNDREVGGVARQHGARHKRVQEFFGAPDAADAEKPRAIQERIRFDPSDFGLPDEVDLANPPPDCDDDDA
ncbi:MAG: NYN domain-containing protein [Planctomycetota bacterium]|jgi:predicted RNA-binding protein with PIN domain